MRILIQRVKKASVKVNEQVCGEIKEGLLVFLGVNKNDTPDKTLWLAQKVVNLRAFRDDQGKMNRNIREVNGNILVVSQFTLYADCTYSRRPDFGQAALPELAFLLYEKFIAEVSHELGQPIQTGVFGASMEIDLVNDGPVTFIIEK